MKQKLNLQGLLEDMKTYQDSVVQAENIIQGLSRYEVARMCRDDIKLIYGLNKGDFTFYYAMSRDRLQPTKDYSISPQT